MSVDITKGATVELVKTLSDDLRTKDDNTKYSSAGAAMRDKANVDGYYENLVSGGTEQILSSVYEEDSEPYLFRTSGGSLDIGDREEDTIVGGTVAWNQIARSITSINKTGGTVTVNDNIATFLANGANQQAYFSLALYSNHKCLFTVTYKCTTPTTDVGVRVLGNNREGTATTSWQTITGMIVPAATGNGTIGVQDRRTSDWDNVDIKNIMVFDLTQMFGTTIADYIYSLETATAGAGVAYFKKLFPKPYYAYDAGTLKSVEGLQSHDMVGFNAWDEEWEVGGISNTTGNNSPATNRVRSKNLIPCVPNTTYYFYEALNANKRIFFYDANKKFIVATDVSAPNQTFVTDTNAWYMRFIIVASDMDNNKICINLHWDGERDGEYEPYKKRSYPLDSSLVLRGIFKLDENNNLRCDGDVYKADGTVERRFVQMTLNGSESWRPSDTSISNNGYFLLQVGEINTVVAGSILSTKYVTTIITGSTTAVGISIANSAARNQAQISIRPENISGMSAAQFKELLANNPVTVVYELAEPTTEQAEPYTNPQIVDDFGTEEYVTDSIVPVGHVTKYMPNLKAKLEMAPDSPSDNGDYIVRHTNGQNEYVPLVIPTELPAMPTDNGTYRLKVTVSNGTATLSWESES